MKRKDKEPLWFPDKGGEYHLGDLMYNLEQLKTEDRKELYKELAKKDREDGDRWKFLECKDRHLYVVMSKKGDHGDLSCPFCRKVDCDKGKFTSISRKSFFRRIFRFEQTRG